MSVSSESNKYFKATHTILFNDNGHNLVVVSIGRIGRLAPDTQNTGSVLHTPMLLFDAPQSLSILRIVVQLRMSKTTMSFFVLIVVPPEREWV